jgi:hypothetical protein
MQKDIRFLLVFLIIAIGVLVWLQCYHCNPVPNAGFLKSANTNTQHFTVDNRSQQSSVNNKFKNPGFGSNTNSDLQSRSSNKNKGLSRKIEDEDRARSSRESQKVTSKIVDNILKNETEQNPYKKSRFFDNNLSEELAEDNLSEGGSQLTNPLGEDINSERNSLMDSDQQVLDELIKEVNTGNDLIVDNPKSELYKSRSRSINSAKKYRNISYKDSGYRYDFDDNGDPTQTSQDELNSMYDDAMVFRNNEYNTNGNFKGFNETDQTYGGANLNDFKSSGPQTQQEKIMSLYNSNEYLPNNNMLDKKLTKGFQILDNPVAVSNPNLIPVLKSIPVSSVMGSNRNQTYDIRAEPPCPKTVVSPFLNSSIMPDIYSTQRGCL